MGGWSTHGLLGRDVLDRSRERKLEPWGVGESCLAWALGEHGRGGGEMMDEQGLSVVYAELWEERK